jgi:predicted GTPase
MPKPLRCIILGAAGRDFRDFQMFFRERVEYQVVAFTAAQIPFIEKRSFRRSLPVLYIRTISRSSPNVNFPFL